MKEDAAEIDTLKLELADYFCEDGDSFKLEDCFKIFYTFCSRFRKALEENTERKVLLVLSLAKYVFYTRNYHTGIG